MQDQKIPTEKKAKIVNYFNEETEKSIIKFQNEPDIEIRKKIFVDEIRPAFCKLIENIIFVYKFHALGGIDALKNDCLSFLFENLYKFNGNIGHKAFSYFGVICKNWFIQRVKTHKKRNHSDISLDKNTLSFLENEYYELSVASCEEASLKKEFIILIKEEIKTWRNKFDKDQEKKVLEAVILLFENSDLISIYSKKGIYLYLREITNLNTKQVVTNLMKLRRKYDLFKKRYFECGE